MTTHQVKSWPEYFTAIAHDLKTFDLRKDDRPGGYQPGDIIQFGEFRPGLGKYTGRKVTRRVTYVLRDFDGLLPGYCIVGLTL